MTEARKPTAAIKTIGCKLNQFESQQMREQFERLGCRIVPFDEPADIFVINTCTVTSRTDRNCRRLIRKAKRENPGSFVAATGCYAEMQPGVLRDIPAADLVVGNAGKAQIARLIRQRLEGAYEWAEPMGEEAEEYSLDGRMVRGLHGHTRAFVKVQEGCDAHCAYCIICQARGPSRSAASEDVVRQAECLIDAGHPEIVLIGTHLGQYGEDLKEDIDLVGLVERLCDMRGLGRLRLSSIEPLEVPDRLIELVAYHPKVCRHLHLPMQHGSDRVLRRMRRPYDSAFYAELIERIHDASPGTCLGADVIVGFPGATEEEFEATYALIDRLPLSYLHVFTYSPRPGTPAVEMDGQLEHETRIERNHKLQALSEQKRATFARTMVGDTVDVVFERPAHDRAGVMDGITDNYLRAYVPAPESVQGTMREVTVTGADDGQLEGVLEQ